MADNEHLTTIKAMERSHKMTSLCGVKQPGSLSVYKVTNSARRNINVLASSPECARFFALSEGHIRNEANATIILYDADWHLSKRNSGSAIGRAIIAGWPGVLKSVGNSVIVDGHVYIPMTPIAS